MFGISRDQILTVLLMFVFAAAANAQDGFSVDSAKSPEIPGEIGAAGDKAEDAKQYLKDIERDIANETDAEKIFEHMTDAAPAAYLVRDFAKARQYSTELLKRASEFKESWNYGNAVHIGNVVLGLVELTDGKDALAKEYLLKAGQTPGSPQLDTFGPNMMLARDFLAKGERDVVIKYFDLCAKFWKGERGKLGDWKAAINRNEMPDFGPNLKYGM